MSSERDTSGSARPGARSPGSRSGRDQTLLGDLTRPIPAERRLVRRTAFRWAIGLGALAVMVGLLAAMFVLPYETWGEQNAAIAAKRDQLLVLDQVNANLAAEVGHLQTIDGARQAARDEMGLVGPGEARRTMIPNELSSLTLPNGFPYDAISQAVATRAAGSTPPP